MKTNINSVSFEPFEIEYDIPKYLQAATAWSWNELYGYYFIYQKGTKEFIKKIFLCSSDKKYKEIAQLTYNCFLKSDEYLVLVPLPGHISLYEMVNNVPILVQEVNEYDLNMYNIFTFPLEKTNEIVDVYNLSNSTLYIYKYHAQEIPRFLIESISDLACSSPGFVFDAIDGNCLYEIDMFHFPPCGGGYSRGISDSYSIRQKYLESFDLDPRYLRLELIGISEGGLYIFEKESVECVFKHFYFD